MEQKFKIRVKSLDGPILTFHNVKSYTASHGLIEFIDNKTKLSKIFSAAQCEIEREPKS